MTYFTQYTMRGFATNLLIILIISSQLVSCSVFEQIFSTQTPTPTRTFTPTPTASPTPTSTPTFTPTFTPTKTSTPTNIAMPTVNPNWSIFENEWITLYYPQDWIVDERTNDSKCVPGVIDCILRLYHSQSEDITITLVKFNLGFGKTIDAAQVDESLWNAEILQYSNLNIKDPVKLISEQVVEVDGRKAIKRIFQQSPIIDAGEVKQGVRYILRVLVGNDDDTYHFYMRTTKLEDFELYQEIANGIVSSFRFTK